LKLYDISLELNERLPVWPGDTPFQRVQSLDIEKGDWVSLSSISCSLHSGTHADAPCHYRKGAESIGEVELTPYLGPAQLLRLNDRKQGAIRWEELELGLKKPVERLLICANPALDRQTFPNEFRFLSLEAAEALGRAGLLLLGTDAPSVDAVDSQDLPVHILFGSYGIRILENLQLAHVPAGEYELIALPLAIDGGDASPVRAVLRESPHSR